MLGQLLQSPVEIEIDWAAVPIRQAQQLTDSARLPRAPQSHHRVMWTHHARSYRRRHDRNTPSNDRPGSRLD